MNSRVARVAYGVVAVLLLIGSGWSFNIATYNCFAADFHNQYSQAYASRGNIFFLVALALFAGSVSVTIAILRSKNTGGSK
jgi:uncharacterized membrane protein YidH (DUF202 family)